MPVTTLPELEDERFISHEVLGRGGNIFACLAAANDAMRQWGYPEPVIHAMNDAVMTAPNDVAALQIIQGVAPIRFLKRGREFLEN